jgi:hypothetical protein
MLGEQVRGGNPQQATTSSGLAHLEDGSVLQPEQPEQLNGSAGKPQSTRSERQAGGRTHEQLVSELLAQLGDVPAMPLDLGVFIARPTWCWTACSRAGT